MTGPTPALTYATPAPAAGSPVAAGNWVALAGLVLILFGGCFCIGILLLTLLTTPALSGGGGPTPATLSTEQEVLMFALYGCAVGCFAVGGWLLLLGVRKLLAVGK